MSSGRGRLPIQLFTALTATASLIACGDDNPFGEEQAIIEGLTGTVFSLSREERNKDEGWDFVNGISIRVEISIATGLWDFTLDTRDGELVMLPPAYFQINSEARIAEITDQSFDALRIAPGDSTLYSREDPVPLKEGGIYVVRTRDVPNPFSSLCRLFAKIEAVEVDPIAGVFRFRYDLNPNCNDLRFVLN